MGMNSTEKLFVTEKNKIKRCCLFKNQNDPLSAGESRFLLLLLLLGTLQNNNSMGPINRLTYFLPAWVKLCVFIRALQLKMGTRFAELGQENMPPLLPPIFLYLLLSGGALQTTKCLLHPPSKPSPPPGLTRSPCLCLPPQAAASCEPQLCISFSPVQPWSLDAKFSSRLYKQSGVQLETELDCAVLKVLLLLLAFANCLAMVLEM